MKIAHTTIALCILCFPLPLHTLHTAITAKRAALNRFMDSLALGALKAEAGGWNRHRCNAFMPTGRACQNAVLLNLVSGDRNGFILPKKHSIP
jgi:hypothetical protein